MLLHFKSASHNEKHIPVFPGAYSECPEAIPANQGWLFRASVTKTGILPGGFQAFGTGRAIFEVPATHIAQYISENAQLAHAGSLSKPQCCSRQNARNYPVRASNSTHPKHVACKLLSGTSPLDHRPAVRPPLSRTKRNKISLPP